MHFANNNIYSNQGFQYEKANTRLVIRDSVFENESKSLIILLTQILSVAMNSGNSYFGLYSLNNIEMYNLTFKNITYADSI
jgi:hypothetical protein